VARHSPSSSTTDQTSGGRLLEAGSSALDGLKTKAKRLGCALAIKPDEAGAPPTAFQQFKRAAQPGHQRSAGVATSKRRPSWCHGSWPPPGPYKPPSFFIARLRPSPQASVLMR